MSDGDSDDENVDITLNYQGSQRAIEEFNFDYNYLYTKALKAFNIDKNIYKLLFYYINDEKEKKEINENTYYSDFRSIYVNSGKELMIYIETQLKENVEEKKEEKIIEIKKQDSSNDNEENIENDLGDSNFSQKQNDRKNFYDDVDKLAQNLKTDSKTEENKVKENSVLSKDGVEKKEDIYLSEMNVRRKNSKYTSKDLREAQSKHADIKQKQEKSRLINEQLKQEINEIKEKIEKSKIAINNQNNQDEEEQNKLIIKLKEEENNLKKLEANKLKQIEDLKTKNSNIKNMISTLSSTLNKQNVEKSQISELNHEISFKEDITIIPNNNTTFFSVIGDASQYFPKSEIFVKKKEAKLKKIKILNKIYAQRKKKLTEASILEINSSKKREESFNSSLIIKKKQRSKIFNLNKSKKEDENNDNDNNNNEINKENKLLKDDINDLEDKIKEALEEIEKMKNLYDKEIKSLQEKK